MAAAPREAMIVGTGLVGALWSIYLSRRGYKVSMFERRPDLRHVPADSGRSINLALSHRGLSALEHVGVRDQVEELAIPMAGRMIHQSSGGLDFHPYSHDRQAILSVSRGRLNALLLDLAEQDALQHGDKPVFFEHRCNRIDLDSARASFTDEYRNIDYTKSSDVIFGADGANSIVRRALMQQQRRFNYRQSFLEHGYKELTIPPRDGDYAFEPNALHIWPRGQYMLIALPNIDKTFTATLFLAHEGNAEREGFSNLTGKEIIRDFFERSFRDASQAMPDLESEFLSNPVSDLGTVRCEPWHHADKACLLGDAAHAIVPFYGQGLNAGFEDCLMLDQLMDQYDLASAFSRYSATRKKDADAIADLALENFIEMRDRVVDKQYLLCRAIEEIILEHRASRYQTQYHMVTFSSLSYSEAKRRGAEQKAFIRHLADRAELQNDLFSEESQKIILDETDTFLAHRDV